MSTSRWPDWVRDDLPVGMLSESDIDGAWQLTNSLMLEPEDPDWNPVMHGLVCAARAVLVECEEALRMERQALSGELDFSREFVASRISEAITARRVARKVINELRRVVPLSKSEVCS